MILYDKSLEFDLRECGITIPIRSSRPDVIMRFLESAAFSVYTLVSAAELLHLRAPVLKRTDLERVHSAAYIERLYSDGLMQELLTCYELVNDDGSYNRYKPETATRPLTDIFENALRIASGTYLASRLALESAPHFCYYLGGGNHHARFDAPSGFCLLNDVIITARKLLSEHRADLIWIIDVDAHKGDGTAELVQFSRDMSETFFGKSPEILTLSAHMASGWPLDEKSLAKAQTGRAPLVASDIDIPIEAHEEQLYSAKLAGGLAKLDSLSAGRKPDLALVVDGADVYEHDALASSKPLSLTLAQCLERDHLIFSFLRKRNIPSCWLMAGGYGDAAWEPTAHFLAHTAFLQNAL
jgi:acetoin utilization deacetylase AcuC-like enzyme